MIGDREEIERCVGQLYGASTDMVDGLTPGKPVGIVRGRTNVERVGIKGPSRVNVEVAKIGVAHRVGFDLLDRGIGNRFIAVERLLRATGADDTTQNDRNRQPFHRRSSLSAW